MVVFAFSEPPPGADLHARHLRMGMSALIPVGAAIGLALLSRGLLLPAIALFAAILYAAPMAAGILVGLGVHSIGMALWPIVIMLLGFAWGAHAAIAVTLVFVASIVGLLTAELGGVLPGPTMATLGGPIFFGTVFLLLMVLVCWLTIRYAAVFFAALDAASRSSQELKDTNQALRQSKASLRKQNEQLAAILNATTESIFHIDAEGIVLAINATGAHRLQKKPEEMLGKCVFDFFPPDVAASRRAMVNEVLAAGEKRYLEDARGDRFFALNYYPVCGENGKAESLVVFATDITDRKKAEAEGLATAQRLRLLMRTATDGIHIVDERGNIVEANEAFCDMLGYTAEEVSHLNVADWDAQWSPEELSEKIEVLLTQGHGVFETRHRRKDGALMDVEISASVVKLDGHHYVYAAARDIAERKKNEQRLARSEERMELALEGANLGMWDLDLASGEFTHNPRLVTMLGYAPGEVAVNAKTFRSLLHPDDAPGFGSAFFAHLKGETPNLAVEYRVRHKDDHWVWVLSHGKVVERDDNGRALRMTGTNQDISERKRTEAELVMREARLSTLLASMQDLVFVFDTGGAVVEYFHPPLFHSPVRESREAVRGKTYAEILPAGAASGFDTAIVGIMTDGQPRTFEYTFVMDGREYVNQATMSPLRGQSKYPTGFLAAVRDVTAERAARSEIERLGRSNALLLESVGEGIYGVDLAYRATFVNPSALAMLGYTEAELRGHEQHHLFHHHRQDGTPYPESECPVSLTLADGRIRHDDDEWFWRKDGSGFPVAMTVTPVIENERRVGAVVIFKDISERKAAEEKIRDLAFYDALTRLPNRRLLLDRLEQTLAASQRNGFHGALMFLDLDNFKPLNDAHGHAVGDLLLVEVANRLKGCVREADTVARFGGDEFVVMLGELSKDRAESTLQARAVAEKIRRSLSEPYRLTVRNEAGADISIQHRCAASIGVAMFVDRENTQDDILKLADDAMYRAKEAGRNSVQFAPQE